MEGINNVGIQFLLIFYFNSEEDNAVVDVFSKLAETVLIPHHSCESHINHINYLGILQFK